MTLREIRWPIHVSVLLALVTTLASPASAQERRRIEPIAAQESSGRPATDWSASAEATLAIEPDSAASWAWPVAMMGAMVGAGLSLIASDDCGTGCISIPILEASLGALIGGAVGYVVGSAITALRD